MQRRKAPSRAKQRQALLRELASEEIFGVADGVAPRRAVEAVEALRRIQDGTYGVCLDCGKRIPAARLSVKPEASRCVSCQSEYEERMARKMEDWNVGIARSA